MTQSCLYINKVRMANALLKAKNLFNICTSVPFCQSSLETKHSVKAWASDIRTILNSFATKAGSWEASTLVKALETYDAWMLSTPADDTTVYTNADTREDSAKLADMQKMLADVRGELEDAQDKLAAVRKELGEMRAALLAYRRAYEGTKQAIYLASQKAACIQEELYRVLPSAYTKPAEPCGLTGEEQ